MVNFVGDVLIETPRAPTDLQVQTRSWVDEQATKAGLLDLLAEVQGLENAGLLFDEAPDMPEFTSGAQLTTTLIEYYARWHGEVAYLALGTDIVARPDLVLANGMYSHMMSIHEERKQAGCLYPDKPNIPDLGIYTDSRFQACPEWITKGRTTATLTENEPVMMPREDIQPIARGTDRSDLTAQVQTLTSALPFDKQFLATMVAMYFSLLLDYAEMMQADFAEFQETTNARIAKIERDMLQ